MREYLIGIDGGNTKTDYLLFKKDGTFVDGVRLGTCSHESAKIGGFDNAFKEMNKALTTLLSQNNLTFDDVDSIVGGLAGCDVPFQHEELVKRMSTWGVPHLVVANDGTLGVKAACLSGAGVCSINGTGTVNVGVDETGKFFQVGGIGYVAGDEGGGSYLARTVTKAAFSECFRFGPKTSLTKNVFEMYGICDKFEFTNAIATKNIDSTYLIKACFKAANEGDEVAIGILRDTGTAMASSMAGVITNLTFNKDVDCVLAGSVWAKATSDVMLKAFEETLTRLTGKKINFIVLTLPPAIGAILWALEVANGAVPNEELRTIVTKGVENYQHRFN